MCRSEDTSYLARTSSGSASRRWNWVGTMCDVVTRRSSMSAQHVLGQPLVHQHDGVPEVHRRAPEAQHRRVVERRADDVDVVVLGLDPEEEQQPGQPERGLLGGDARSVR